jgi:tyrosyl-tRNA synthetase
MVLARENLSRIGYKARIEIMNPLVPGLVGKKMSASDEKSKIDLLDDEQTIMKKLQGADCVAGNPDNGILAFLKYVLMPVKQDKKDSFVVKRDTKYGGDMIFRSYEEIENLFIKKELHPLDLKNAVALEISNLLKPIQKNRKILEELSKKAYK